MKRRSALTIFLLTVSLCSFTAGGYLISHRYTPKTSAVSATQTAGIPVVLLIPDLGIKLPIVESRLIDGKWEATDRGVSYLTDSPLPGSYGNSILYGHDWPVLLEPIKKAKMGQTLEIQFSDGTTQSFKIVETKNVTPDQTHIIYPTDDKRLTIYTCNGFLDSKRFVVTAIISSG